MCVRAPPTSMSVCGDGEECGLDHGNSSSGSGRGDDDIRQDEHDDSDDCPHAVDDRMPSIVVVCAHSRHHPSLSLVDTVSVADDYCTISRSTSDRVHDHSHMDCRCRYRLSAEPVFTS